MAKLYVMGIVIWKYGAICIHFKHTDTYTSIPATDPSDDYDDIMNRHSVCLISDRFAQPGLNLSSSQSSWIWSLQDKFGKERLTITAPDYASVFAGQVKSSLFLYDEISEPLSVKPLYTCTSSNHSFYY